MRRKHLVLLPGMLLILSIALASRQPSTGGVADAETVAEIVGATDYNDQTHAQILRLYQAVFGRSPDVRGAKYWIDINEHGHEVLKIAGYMSGSQEWANAYNGTTDEEFLSRVYTNVLGRDFDPDGYAYWLDTLKGTNHSGANPDRIKLTRPAMVFYVADNPEFASAYPFTHPYQVPPSPDPVPPPPDPDPPPPKSFMFTAGGDIGATSETTGVLQAIAAAKPQFHLALGDLGYGDTPTEAEWCRYVSSHLGEIPMQLVVGNHEDDDRVDGYIGDFAACLPDRMGSTGVYAAEYYFDVEGLARIVMIGAGNDYEGEKYDYELGNAHYQWLAQTIDDARAMKIPWIIVGMHKVCISAGSKSCEIDTAVMDLLIDKRVDLVLQAHEHNYQRSKQVRCITENRYREACIVDDGSDDAYTKGAGTVWAVSGLMGGGGKNAIYDDDPEYEYLAASHGGNSRGFGRGFSQVLVSSESLTLEFIGTSSTFGDRFTIHR